LRVERTFAFLDLCGYTRYTELKGDDAAVAVLAQLRAVLRAVSEQRGVRITKWLGDGAMLSGIDAEPVIACAVEVRDRVAAGSPLPLRGGIARGPVIMFEGDDYVGAAANLAARLCRAASANRLLAAADVLDGVAARGIVARHLRDIVIDGIDGAVPVVELLSGGEPEGAAAGIVRRLR
jgi:adenylate cyclase